ncbi:MAG: tail fiber domain-containing protein [Bacteroidota bacterium]
MKQQHIQIAFSFIFLLSFSALTMAQNSADYPDNGGPGFENTLVGFQTSALIGAGDDQNTFTGALAGAGINGHFANSYYGHAAGFEHNGEFNVMVGHKAGVGGTSKGSIHIGFNTGTGSFGVSNIFLGTEAGAGRNNINEKLYIARDAGTPLIYGDFGAEVVGINTENPLGTMDVRGTNIILTDPGVTAATFTANRATALGQNGGPGGSPLCNLYGFRAQNNINNSINVGMNNNSPTILWDNGGADILTFARRTPFAGAACQALILRLGDNIGGTYEFDLNGDGRVSASWLVLSDRRIKSDVQGIDNALDLITRLNGVSYTYNKSKYPEMNLPDGRVYGFIAQEVKEVIPNVTHTSTEDDMVGIKYTEIIPILTQGIKEQQDIITEQENQITELNETITDLEDRLAAIEQAMSMDGTSKRNIGSDLASDFQKIRLSQNRPNPFGEITTVEYEIPANTKNATLDVYSMEGKLMSTYDIQGGAGKVEIESDLLQNGTYVYAININGSNVATNLMIIQR